MKVRAWMPFVLLTTLIVALGGYTALRQDAFLELQPANLLLADDAAGPRLARVRRVR